jgi:peroxiredoxin
MTKKLIAVSFLFMLTNFFLQTDQTEKVKNFTLKDYTGVVHSLYNYKDSKAVVIIFIATRCPVSNGYNERMEKLFEDYKDKNVTFLGINSNKQESVDEIAEHAKKNDLHFTILKDPGNKIADEFEASFTPEIYVLNSNFEILYHGRIDDSRRGDNIQHQDLRNALNEILADKKVSFQETKAFGCTIKRVN